MGLLYGVILVVQIIEIYSVSKISVLDVDETLAIATADIVNECFGSYEHWSELLIINDHDHASDGIIGKIYDESKTSNLIVYLDGKENNEFTHRNTECNDYLNMTVACQESRTTAVMITTHSLEHLEYVINIIKNNIRRLWRPGSYFLIVLEIRCDAVDYNDMLKVMWDNWILNAMIMCSSNNPANQNRSEIELYTFNPYSSDHSKNWKIIINETVEVFIDPGKFNHSWYIFKQRFNGIQTLGDCGNIFFDKTSNLDGYVIPISLGDLRILPDNIESNIAIWFAGDIQTLKTISKKLRFDVAKVSNNATLKYGLLLENGSYTGILNDLYTGRSHLAPTVRGMRLYPGLGKTYPHDRSGACLASWNTGIRPQWTNLAVAKHIWIGLGVSILFATLVLYIQNKSHGIVSAFLDSQRLFVGSSIIRMPTLIKHRIMIGSILIVVLVIDGAIKGRFISILTAGRPYPNIETIEQLEQLDVEIYGPLQFKEGIRHPRLIARYNISLQFPECLNITERKTRQRACFVDCRWLLFLATNSSDIYRGTTPAWSYDLQLLTMLNWPMADRYSFEIQKLVETGIFKKWQFDIFRKLEVNGWKWRRAAESLHVREARLNDLLPAFVVLAVGLSFASIVFVWEKKNWQKLYLF